MSCCCPWMTLPSSSDPFLAQTSAAIYLFFVQIFVCHLRSRRRSRGTLVYLRRYFFHPCSVPFHSAYVSRASYHPHYHFHAVLSDALLSRKYVGLVDPGFGRGYRPLILIPDVGRSRDQSSVSSSE